MNPSDNFPTRWRFYNCPDKNVEPFIKTLVNAGIIKADPTTGVARIVVRSDYSCDLPLSVIQSTEDSLSTLGVAYALVTDSNTDFEATVKYFVPGFTLGDAFECGALPTTGESIITASKMESILRASGADKVTLSRACRKAVGVPWQEAIEERITERLFSTENAGIDGRMVWARVPEFVKPFQIMVLNDGETYTNVEGCKIVLVPGGTSDDEIELGLRDDSFRVVMNFNE